MKITGTLINYYFHCKRQCWLLGNRINLEDNSEDVHIGRVLHEIKTDNKKNTELSIENIKIDKITDEFLVELKKSDTDIEAAKWQVLLYLKILKEKGINKKGKIIFDEKKKGNNKFILVELTDNNEKELEKIEKDILSLIEGKEIPLADLKRGCKKCAYYEYCYI
ncbi:CRISPR-associated protein Cas4 [Clostridium fallax]|uniref:CRISPR-associated exonuclease Cas4 n=1 Tax=Clostridium fallax TaxID=1533 RepID=A0A1M4XVR6_9CLOT|nr:CRISPR-associated protein Cas4 [Clostridium fallax]SHE97684.1 CRISPR-associated exonuclease Cas4 [Clostridium fallax]SQB06505.1 CRISPR-associated Cas4 family protein [Clostridium fallax]